MKATLKSKQKEESRKKILKSASSLFKEQGFSATGVDELMEKAGLTAGAFYAHFTSKSELLEQALIFMMEESGALMARGAENMQGRALVEAALAKYVSEAHRDHPQRGCALPAIAAEICRGTKKTNEIVQIYMEKWIKWFAQNLEGSNDERRTRSMQIISQAVGAVLLSRMVAKTDLSSEILKAGQKI